MKNDLEKVAKAVDTQDLLEHIAWTALLKPQLLEAKRIYIERLVAMTLGAPTQGTETKEQIAGRLYGINLIITKFESILAAGADAEEYLASQNIFFDK